VNGSLLKAQWSDALKVVGKSSADEAFHHPSYFAIYRSAERSYSHLAILSDSSAIWRERGNGNHHRGRGLGTGFAGFDDWTAADAFPLAAVRSDQVDTRTPAVIAGTVAGAWLYREST
jgi:hypothetical protein